MSDNHLVNPDINPQTAILDAPYISEAMQPLVLNSSSNVSISGNTVDRASRRMWVTDTQFNELAAYAPGSTYRLSAFNLGTQTDPKVTLTDSSGTTTAVTISNTSTHAVDVVIPATAALGAAYFTLTAANTKYFATLFVDGQENIPALNGCTWEVSPSASSIGPGADSLPILVITQAGCSWEMVTGDSFVVPGAGGSATGVTEASFAATPGLSRTATIEIAAQQIAIIQDAHPALRRRVVP